MECPTCGEVHELKTVFESGVECPDCRNSRDEEALHHIKAPEGGWPRGSDMDRL